VPTINSVENTQSEFRTFILLFVLRKQRVTDFRSSVVMNWVEYVKYNYRVSSAKYHLVQ